MTVLDIGRAEVLRAQPHPMEGAAPTDRQNTTPLGTRRRSRFGWLPVGRLLTFAARGLLWQGFSRPALLFANAALAMAPDSADANVVAAKLLQRRGEIDGALMRLRAAVTQDGSAKRAHWELAKLLLRRRRASVAAEVAPTTPAELVAALREAGCSTQTGIRRPALVALSNALYVRGEYADALAAADAALAAAPEDMRAMRARAIALLPHRRIADGHALFERMLAKDPANNEIARKVQVLGSLAAEISRSRPTRHEPQDEVPLLIGIGAGIGDMLHATPLIRNAARRGGRPVDVVVLADHPGAEFLVDNSAFVRRVSTVTAAVLERRYRTVFLTHSFGPLRFAFNAERVCAATSWRSFRPGGLHETLFNLEAAKHLLGLPYDVADASAYFVNALRYQSPAVPLVGLHAGSKSGRWLSKRWPLFEALAKRLTARGIPVASFGTADEYVEGTENRTGGSIEEMCRAMLDCSHFVSNDSGPMHVASALGIPVLVLFAPTDPMSRLPLAAATQAIAVEKDCAPCEVKNHGHFSSGRCHCIGEISVEEVEARLLRLLGEHALPDSLRIAGERAAR